jgi:hypothetical protein
MHYHTPLVLAVGLQWAGVTCVAAIDNPFGPQFPIEVTGPSDDAGSFCHQNGGKFKYLQIQPR